MVVIRHTSGLATGWESVPRAMWATLASVPAILDRARNADVLYEMVVFDALIRNVDRHERNLCARRMDQRQADYDLFVYDHDRALLPPGVTPATIALRDLAHLDSPGLWIRIPEVARRIVSRERLQQAVAHLRGTCAVADIRAIMDSTPAEWLAADEVALVRDFLIDRADRLGELVEAKAAVALPRLH